MSGDDNERGNDDIEYGRGGGASTSGSPSPSPVGDTGLTGSFSFTFFLFGAFFEYFRLCVPAAVSSYRWE